MAISGMDYQEVSSIGHQLIQQADQIQQVIAHVDGLIARAEGVWHGDDARHFQDWWTQQHRPHLVQAHDAVHGLGQSAINNAAEQQQVSGR